MDQKYFNHTHFLVGSISPAVRGSHSSIEGRGGKVTDQWVYFWMGATMESELRTKLKGFKWSTRTRMAARQRM